MSESLKRPGTPVVEEEDEEEEEEEFMILTQVPEVKVQTQRSLSSSGKVRSQIGQLAVGKVDGHVGKKAPRTRFKKRKKSHSPGEFNCL